MSGAPGFSIGNVHVMAGVPSIFVAMLAVVLPRLEAGTPRLSREVRFEVGEGRVATPLRRLAEEMPQLSIGSYPFRDGEIRGTNIVVRGTDPALLDRGGGPARGDPRHRGLRRPLSRGRGAGAPRRRRRFPPPAGPRPPGVTAR